MITGSVSPNRTSTTLTDSYNDSQNIRETDWDGRIITTAEHCLPVVKQNLPVIGAAAITAGSLAGGAASLIATAALAYTSNALTKVTHASSPGGQAPTTIVDDACSDSATNSDAADGVNHVDSPRNNQQPELSIVEPFIPLFQDLSGVASDTGTMVTNFFEYVSRSPFAYFLLDDPINSMLTHNCLEDLKSCLDSIFFDCYFRTKCKEFIVKAAKQEGYSESVKALFDTGYKPDYMDIHEFIKAGNRDIVLAALNNMNRDIALTNIRLFIYTAITHSNSDDIVLDLFIWGKEHNTDFDLDKCLRDSIDIVLNSNNKESDNTLTALLSLASANCQRLYSYKFTDDDDKTIFKFTNEHQYRLEQQMTKAMHNQNETVVDFLQRNDIFPCQITSANVSKFIINHKEKLYSANYSEAYLEFINKLIKHLKEQNGSLKPLTLRAFQEDRMDIIRMIKKSNLSDTEKSELQNLLRNENEANKSSWRGWLASWVPGPRY